MPVATATNEVTVSQAAKDLGTNTKSFVALAKQYYPAIAGSWKASTRIPAEIAENLKAKAQEYEVLSHLPEDFELTDEDLNLNSQEPVAALASGSQFEGLSCQPTADAIASVRACNSALEYAFTQFTQSDFLYLFEAAATKAVTEYKVFTSVKNHVKQQLADADARDRLDSIKKQAATIQSDADQMLADMGISQTSETLGNAQRSEQERTEQAKTRVSELMTSIHQACGTLL